MSDSSLAMVSHLMRRAGFGADRDELESLSAQPYEETVEDLLHPERREDLQEDALTRYNLELSYRDAVQLWAGRWVWRMVNSRRPLEEKMALFWHHVFATAWYKSEHSPTIIGQIEMFREVGMSDLRTILLALAKDPAMNYWLDNCENHADQPNENWGRELLELFSMGVGNYSEDDIKNAARAFTGWTFTQPIPLYPFGHYESEFRYLPDDHDGGEKTFLGQSGAFGGEDIIEIVAGQDATYRFIARHLYNFFVADEPQVPAWNIEPPRNPDAIEVLSETFVDGGFEIKPVLRQLFNSDFFKEAQYQKVKSPTEVVVGTLRSTRDMTGPDPRLEALGKEPGYMGQDILDPPSVEGWHTGREWINSGSLVKRVNFVADRVSDASLPGVKAMLDYVGDNGATMSAEELVDRCLDIMGPMEVDDRARAELVTHAAADGAEITVDSDDFAERATQTFALIAATREYQFG